MSHAAPAGGSSSDTRLTTDPHHASPNAPIDEGVRARAVQQLAVLDSPREERFDRLTRLARQVLQVPIAYVSIADGDRLWMKSIEGADIPEAKRDETFCHITLDLERPFLVPDALADDRLSTLPSVLGEPFIRSYVGFPLTDANGITVGTFCVADTQPRDFTETDLQVLDELTGWARQELVSSTDAARARQVQQRLLPDRIPQPRGYDVAGLCVPSQSVGGDFYDVGQADTGIAFVLADVMGKGTAAAIVSATVRAAVQSVFRAELRTAPAGDPVQVAADVLAETARTLQRDLDATGTIVTAFVGHVSTEHRVSWVDAGHGLAVLTRADGRAEWLTADDLPLGVDPDGTWTGRTTDLDAGDQLTVFSDGLLDLFGGTADAKDRIVGLLSGTATAREAVDRIRDLLQRTILIDDVTALVIRRCE